MTKEEAKKLAFEPYVKCTMDFNGIFDLIWKLAKADKPEPCVPDKPGWCWITSENYPAFCSQFKLAIKEDGSSYLFCEENGEPITVEEILNHAPDAKFWPAIPPWERSNLLEINSK